MFSPPVEITATIFARLPDSFRGTKNGDPWVRLQRNDAPTHSFLEAPCFDGTGNLHLVDIPNGRIFRVSPAGEFSLVVEYDGNPNGLKFRDDGCAVVADHKNGLMLLDPVKGTIQPLVSKPALGDFKGLNDLVFARNGDLYFTDQGQSGLHDPTGRLWKLDAAGRLVCLLDNVPSPNGVALSADGSTIYLAATRDNAIWRVPLHVDGSVGRVGRFIQLSGSLGGPDGIAMLEDGGLAVCHIGMGAVWVFDRLGQPKLRIQTAGLLPTNAAFGGPERRTLFITEAEEGVVLWAQTGQAGMSLHRPPAPQPLT